MSKKFKTISRLLSKPSDFTWDELVAVLNFFGYAEMATGKTGGSRRKFVSKDKSIISIHKPHPSNIIKRYALDDIISHLKEKGKLDE